MCILHYEKRPRSQRSSWKSKCHMQSKTRRKYKKSNQIFRAFLLCTDTNEKSATEMPSSNLDPAIESRQNDPVQEKNSIQHITDLWLRESGWKDAIMINIEKWLKMKIKLQWSRGHHCDSIPSCLAWAALRNSSCYSLHFTQPTVTK